MEIDSDYVSFSYFFSKQKKNLNIELSTTDIRYWLLFTIILNLLICLLLHIMLPHIHSIVNDSSHFDDDDDDDNETREETRRKKGKRMLLNQVKIDHKLD